MGVKLMVEVMDHAPETLTPRERYVLVVLAENARDSTRVCLPGIEDDQAFIRRSRLVSRSQRYAVIQALVAKKVLERARRGQKGIRAEYRIVALANTQGPENQDPDGANQEDIRHPGSEQAEPSAQGPENEDPDTSQGPGNQDAETRRGDAQDPSTEASGSRFSGLRVPESGTPYPHTPQEGETSGNDGSPPPAGDPPRKRRKSTRQRDEPPREDVERICNYLAAWVVKNGSKPPTISEKWRTEARLLIDKDGRSLEEIRQVTAWSQRSRFWKPNILSMPKLREKFDTLRLAMEAEAEVPNGRSVPPSNASKPIPPDQQCTEHRGQPGGTRNDGRPKCGQCRAETAGRRNP